MALLAFLAVTRNMAERRAARLDRALMEAEKRIMELEGEMQAANARATNAPVATAASTSPAAVSGARVLFAATTGRGITNLVRIEGTSTVHDWQVEGRLIGGTAEFGPGLVGGPTNPTPPGALDAKATVFIPVRSLKSVERSGKPYSDAMDEIMYGKLKAEEHKRITFTLSSLAPKPQAAAGTISAQYEATGQLSVAGVTNTITMPVSIAPVADAKIQITGSFASKMTDFGITPPSPSVGGMSIKTGDDVKLRFEWWIKPAQPANVAK
jgi:hypothetical protein